MRGLSLVGLVIGLGIVDVLVVNQVKPSPETRKSVPTEFTSSDSAQAALGVTFDKVHSSDFLGVGC